MKKKGEMKSFKIRLPEKLIADLEELASADNRSIANFVRNLLEGFVKAIRAKASE
jgi:predicted DNA-binding protein